MKKRGNNHNKYIFLIVITFLLFLMTSHFAIARTGSCDDAHWHYKSWVCPCYDKKSCKYMDWDPVTADDCESSADSDKCDTGYECNDFNFADKYPPGSHTKGAVDYPVWNKVSDESDNQGYCRKVYCPQDKLLEVTDMAAGDDFDEKCFCGGTNSTYLAGVDEYCCAGVISSEPCSTHEEITYTWYQKNVGDTESDVPVSSDNFLSSGEGNFSGTLNILGDGITKYDLCFFNDYLCTYMQDPNYSDNLSDYYLFFNLNTEFHNITYSEGYVDDWTFGINTPELGISDYRNISVNFCDPDAKSSFCGSSCKLGYNLSLEGMSWSSRKWDAATEECCGDDYNRKSILKPDFLYQHVDEPDFSKNFCTGCPIGVDLNNPNKREWNDVAKCCGDDNGQWYINYDLEGNEVGLDPPDGFNNKADCAKLVNNSQFLCNTHRTNNNQSKWYTANTDPGEIAYIPCVQPLGFEAVSNGTTWIGCGVINPSSAQTHQFTGDFFQEEKRILFEDGWKHSYFCIAPPSQAGIDTIYECCGTRACKSSSNTDPDGGLQTSMGYSFNFGSGLQDTYYCTQQVDANPSGKAISSETTKSTLWSTDLDFTNKASCESAKNPEDQTSAGFIWTGKDFYHIIGNDTINFCCSENDDNRQPYEFYNDPDGIGACFSSVYQPNNNFVQAENHTYTELYILNGSMYGCAIDDYSAISNHCSGPYGSCTGYKSYTSSEYYEADTNKPFDGSFPTGLRNENNFLIDLDNWPNPAELQRQELLVEDNPYCKIIDLTGNGTTGKYYCSYEEIWKETEGKELTHLSFTEWGVGENETRAECCLVDKCWNGNSCIKSQHTNPGIPPINSDTNGYRCIFGEWYYSYLKNDWNNGASGWCPSNTQCLLNPSGLYGNYNSPQCINDTIFIGDNYCENGQWTSRTKFLALQLLDLVENEQKYVLYCDDYKETLNTLDYTLLIEIEDYIKNQRQPRSGIQPFNSVNNFCILRYGTEDDVVIATSLNHPISLSDSTNFLNVFEEQITCPTETTGFQRCGSSGIYYNSELNSIIYSKKDISLSQPQPYWFTPLFTPSHIVFPMSIPIFFSEIYDFLFVDWQPTYGFDLNYNFIEETTDFKKLYVSNQEQIIAITEKVFPLTNKEHITVRYSGTGADICNSIEIYDNSLGEGDYLQCNESQGTHYIVSGLPAGINLWPQLTSKLRPEP